LRRRRTYQQIGADFERHVLRFLKQIGFANIDGGPAHKIGGHQIDASATHENTLLVIDCVTRARGAAQSVRAKIKAMRGIMHDVRQTTRQDRRYRRISDFRFILATAKVGIKKQDLRFAKKDPEVFIWDENLIAYYSSLQKKVGRFAKFNLLAELDVRPRHGVKVRVPCLREKLYGEKVYSFFAPARELLKVSYVARREIALEHYYQRLVDKARLRSIAQFLNQRGNFPNSIVLAFHKHPNFSLIRRPRRLRDITTDVDFGILTLPQQYRSCWIIDGQHRLYAFAMANPDINQDLSVVAFEHLPLDIQAKYFLDINSSQKPVPADLLWDLRGELMPQTPDGVISRVAKRLSDEGSLSGMIYVPSAGVKVRGKKFLKFSGICLNIRRRHLVQLRTEHMDRARERNPLYRSNPDALVRQLSKALIDYFDVVTRTFSKSEKKEFWLQNSGIAILFAIYEYIVHRMHKIPNASEIRTYVTALCESFRDSHYDFSRLRLRCNSEGGRSELALELAGKMALLLRDPQFVPGPRSRFEEAITAFERTFARFIIEKLERAPTVSGDWIKERLPAEIPKRLAETYGRIPDDPSEYLTLGQCRDIVQYHDNWFLVKDAFLGGRVGFPNQLSFMQALDYVGEHRHHVKHGRPLKPGYADEEMRDVYFEKLSKCLAEASQSISLSASAAVTESK